MYESNFQFPCMSHNFYWKLVILDNMLYQLWVLFLSSRTCYFLIYLLCDWLDYLSEVHFLHRTKTLTLILTGYSIGYAHSPPRKTMVLRDSLWLSLPSHCWLVALLFSVVPWGLNYSMDCSIKYGTMESNPHHFQQCLSQGRLSISPVQREKGSQQFLGIQ